MKLSYVVQHGERTTVSRNGQANTSSPQTIILPSNCKRSVYVTGGNVEICAPRLELNLLGTPEIHINGTPARNIERCSRGALVLYLLVLHRRGLSGESLAAELSPACANPDDFEQAGEMSVDALRMLVYRLRKMSGWRGILACDTELGGYQNRYRLPDGTICDVWEFEEKLDEAAALSVRANMEPSSADLAARARQHAISLYKGEFCKGIGLAPIIQGAQYLHQRYLQALMLQANYWKNMALGIEQARLGNGLPSAEYNSTDSALHFPPEADTRGQKKSSHSQLERWFSEERAWMESLSNYSKAAQAEPYEEAAYAGAMLCHAYLGQVEGVRRTLQACSSVFREELGRDPHPSTIDLAGRCLRFAGGFAAL